MLGLVAEETTCRFEGSYQYEGRQNPFSGEVIVRPDGIVIGRNLSDPNAGVQAFDINIDVQSFDIDGFIALWDERLVMIFSMRYHLHHNIKSPDVYHHLYRIEPGRLFEGKWEGWYSVALDLAALNELYEVLLGFRSVEEVETVDFRQGSISPLVKMKDKLSAQSGIKVKLELSPES